MVIATEIVDCSYIGYLYAVDYESMEENNGGRGIITALVRLIPIERELENGSMVTKFILISVGRPLDRTWTENFAVIHRLEIGDRATVRPPTVQRSSIVFYTPSVQRKIMGAIV